MDDKLTFTLKSPITDEQWDKITDADFEHTDRIWFETKHGKVEFVKASAQQKIGHWIELNTHLGRGVVCSECGKLALHQVWSDGCGEIECEYAKSNYCPSCGIKMEEQNETD